MFRVGEPVPPSKSKTEQAAIAVVPEAPAVPTPEPSGSLPETLSPDAGQALALMGGRLIFTLIGAPYAGRGDLAGVLVNNQRAAMAVGNFVTVTADDQTCFITLAQIGSAETKTGFVTQCGAKARMQRQAKPAIEVALKPQPRVLDQLTMAGGTTKMLEPGSSVFSMVATPAGGRGDLVAVSLNGTITALAVGQQLDVPSPDGACDLTVTKLHGGQNKADFLWRCE